MVDNHIKEDHNKEIDKEKVNLKSFNTIKIIGKGSYAKVVLVRKKSNQKLYAMKIIKKQDIKNKKKALNIITERDILVTINCQFIVKMDYAFQNESSLYFLLEYCPGGELFNLLSMKRLKEEHVKFYAVQIILGLKYLHERNIIYRDLKPENIVIDKDGYVKLTDFGLSKLGMSEETKTYSVCGTPEYLAPEILRKEGHNKNVDWWTLGCIVYEMIFNRPPFQHDSKSLLCQQILNTQPIYSNYINTHLQDLLSKLMEKNPETRLGSQGGAEQILQHEWFSDIDINKIRNKQVVPPFVPKLKNETDVQYFDQEFTTLQLSPQDSKVMFVENNTYQHMSGNYFVFIKDFSFQKSSISTQKIKNSQPKLNNNMEIESSINDSGDELEEEFVMKNYTNSLNQQFQ